MSFAASRKERQRPDCQPTGGPDPKRTPDDTNTTECTVTRRLTSRVSFFGRGAQASILSMCKWGRADDEDTTEVPEGGFFLRTTTPHSDTVREVMFSGKLIRKAHREGRSNPSAWREMSVRDTDKSFLNSAFELNKYKVGPDHAILGNGAAYRQFEDYAARESWERGSTLVIAFGVKNEFIDVRTMIVSWLLSSSYNGHSFYLSLRMYIFT